MLKTKSRYFILICVSAMLSGCLGTKHLKDDEKLLYRQGIRVPKYISTDELDNLYAQKPNRKLFGLPIAPLVGIYYWGQRGYRQEKYTAKKEKVETRYDRKIAKTESQKKINNLQFRKQKKFDKLNSYIENGNLRMQWGERVAVFDSLVVKTTEERFKQYLFSKGYFNNQVTTKALSIGKLTSVTYRIEPGQAYVIDSIFFRVADSAVYRLITNNQAEAVLKKGTRYDQENFSRERERIDLLLKDQGYYDFSRQYIEFNIDTAREGSHKVAVMVIINDPSSRQHHKPFVIDSINFITDAGVTSPGKDRELITYRNIHYQQYENQYNKKILSQRIFVSPGQRYSRSNTFATQRQLANLDAFKFVNINYDTAGHHFVANIFTSPLNRYEWTNEFGVNVTQGFPGPFYNINFKKRNIFKGLENFDLNGRIGFEGVAAATSDQNVYRSTEAGANASITFPQFLWPLREESRLWLGKYNPKTRLSFGYTYTDRPEYRRAATTFTNTYTWQNKRTTLYSFTMTNLSVINSDIKTAEFQAILNDQAVLGNFSLVNSFRPSFVNSMIFSITWNPNDYGTQGKTSVLIRAQVESGGTIFNFVSDKPILNQGLQTFKYLRGSVDLRQVTSLTKVTTLAFRLNGGVSYSYASNRSLPYEKFFFAGGSNSVRAWRPRRLGPGSFRPNFSSNPAADGLYDYSIEQPGEVLIEGSIELRNKLFGFVEGAIFMDAGNVWTIDQRFKVDSQSNEQIPNGNSQFKLKSFAEEIGIGTGFGLRFDFTFLILRFDVGIKVYDPARIEGDRFVLDDLRFFRPFSSGKEPVIYNVGIGYPF